MLIVTLYALFADDLRTAFLTKSNDIVVDSFMLAALIFFIFEVVIVSMF
jgi:hypothetical protein